jgi:hypothetical protein
VRNAFSDHLNVAVSTDIVRHALHQACIGSLEKQKKLLLMIKFDGHDWCWVRDGESQLHAHHVSQTITHGGGAIFVWGCMTSCGMHYMCKIEGKMTQTMYISILQDGFMKTIEWYRFKPSCIIFQHYNDLKYTTK